MKLSDVIKSLDGELISEGEFITLNYCTAKSNVMFLTFLENKKYINELLSNKSISCVLCTEEIKSDIPIKKYGVFITKEPKIAFHAIHNSLINNNEYSLPSYKTVIGDNCDISPLAYIATNNVTIGDNVKIGEFVVINENTIIGNNCSIHSGTIIGGKSFSYTRQGTDNVLGLNDMGQVILEDNVEICSNCHIARGTLPTDSTVIGKNTKLDGMVHVGHGTQIGRRVFIAAGAQLSGNTIRNSKSLFFSRSLTIEKVSS
jgi:UDP-3-O-[3-hydroxymyristoyl] glucosamine N-acyltransferase